MFAQTCLPDRIVVVSDNSTDATDEIATSWGSYVELFTTQRNRHMKAGALNQFLATLEADPDDTMVLVMDADSRIVPTFIETATERLRDPLIGAVGGIFAGDGKNGWLGTMQHLEYCRYAREIGRTNARARVLTGTATMAPLRVLRAVASGRASGTLPGHGMYNQTALCEDFCLTMAIKTLGYQCVSPKQCMVQTETMRTVADLWHQRVRWQRGALAVLRSYGVTRTTLPYILRQAEAGIGLVALVALWAITTWSLMTGQFVVHPAWMCVGAIFQIERVVSAWRAGWKGRIAAVTLIGDMMYDLFIGLVYTWVIVQVLLRTKLVWGNPTIDMMQKESS
jgi:cellulose synthase/poly-beta-1,6-N-acetylglucosamine synthase-like glycosyltransferase